MDEGTNWTRRTRRTRRTNKTNKTKKTSAAPTRTGPETVGEQRSRPDHRRVAHRAGREEEMQPADRAPAALGCQPFLRERAFLHRLRRPANARGGLSSAIRLKVTTPEGRRDVRRTGSAGCPPSPPSAVTRAPPATASVPTTSSSPPPGPGTTPRARVSCADQLCQNHSVDQVLSGLGEHS